MSRSDLQGEAALGTLPLLAGLPDAVRDLVADSFVALEVGFGEEIVRQGDEPDGFYVVERGRARVLRADHGAEVPLGVLREGDSFGEAGLLEGTPRQATVRASTAMTVLRLDPALFGAIVRRHPEVAERMAAQARARRLEPLLRAQHMFGVLPADVLAAVAAEMQEQHAQAGDTVVREGDPAGPLYLVVEGRLRVRGDARGDLAFLRAGDVFGEASLFSGTPRGATVEAVSDARLAVLGVESYRRLLDAHAVLRERVAERVALQAEGRAGAVPVDFAEELLPAGARAGDPAADDLGDGAPERPPLRRGGRRRARHVPHVRQVDEADCGPACLAMVCRGFGRAVPLSHIRDLAATSVDGTTLTGITRAGSALGLEVTALKASRDRLDDLALPAIVHWKGNHWIVVDEVAPDRVHVADPGTTSHWMAREEFLEHWSGFTATVSPTPALADQPTDRADLRWLRPFFRPHRAALVLVAALALVAALLQMVVPVVMGDIVDSVIAGDDRARLFTLTGVLLALQVVALGAALLMGRVVTRVAVRIDAGSLDHIAARLLSLPLGYFQSRRGGDIERRLDGMREVREFAAKEGVLALQDLAQIVAAVVLMGLLSWPLMLLWLATLPVFLLIMRFGARRVRPAHLAHEEAFGHYRARRLDAINGVETVKAMGAEAGLRRRMLRDFDDLAQRAVRADLAALTYDTAATFAVFVSLVLFILVGALEVMAGNLSVGALVAFNSLVLLAAGPVLGLLVTWQRWQAMSVILGRLRDIIDREPEQAGPEPRPVASLEGRVTLTNVGFRYPSSPGVPVLEGIHLDVAPGTTVALVGRSGSGKSTLLKCIAGLLQVTEGRVAFDSVDQRELSWVDLRRRIGVVPQAPYVFDDSIAANIAFGEVEPDMEAVRAAAEIADADGFVQRLALGYATRVGDGGLRLSGGQAQRVALARAVYHRPPVLLLDEATSALDTESERAVTENMRRLLEGRTAFVVAHRLSTVRDADLIVVIEQGRVAETGTHDELIARGGLYLHLYGQQLAT